MERKYLVRSGNNGKKCSQGKSSGGVQLLGFRLGTKDANCKTRSLSTRIKNRDDQDFKIGDHGWKSFATGGGD